MEISYTIPGRPITKKNSQRIVMVNKHPIILPSKQYKDWEAMAGWHLKPKPDEPIATEVEVKCLFFMPDRRNCDLVNLLEAVCDCLKVHKIISDDNYKIVYSHDGSRVLYDKDNPRTEIYIKGEWNDKIKSEDDVIG